MSEANAESGIEASPRSIELADDVVPEFTFQITRRGELLEMIGRDSAVTYAKRQSAERHGRIRVDREDGRETIHFERGALVQDLFETRAPRPESDN